MDDIFSAGKELRASVPRTSHRNPIPAGNRPDPIDAIENSSEGRVADLVPVRYARMQASPFTYFRGTAVVMAGDLARFTPNAGLFVQCCGDCHLENFGIFATPERNIIFTIIDFDETLPAPWEWDVKRLAASIHIAGRTIKTPDRLCTRAVQASVRAYREQIRLCAEMTAIEAWYLRVDAQIVLQEIRSAALRQKAIKNVAVAPNYTHEMVAEEYTIGAGPERRIIDKPPKLFHAPPDREIIDDAKQVMERYRDSLRDEFKTLLKQYHVTDLAVKVVGIGSVGTRCAVALLMAQDDDALLLQIKEARPSVLEPYVGKGLYKNQGQRVVNGQRRMQAASDMFLGWTQSDDGHDFYVRQLSDMKGSADVTAMNDEELTVYAGLCGKVLAIAHARSGNSSAIAGYLGRSETYDVAIGEFAEMYADLNESDYRSFLKAIKSGRIRTAEG